MSVCLRHETPADESAIAAVTVAACRNAAHSGHNEHRIVGALRTAGRLTGSLVAEADGQVVGHAAASPVTVSDGAQGWYGLGPVSVLPEHQGRGIGSRPASAAGEQAAACRQRIRSSISPGQMKKTREACRLDGSLFPLSRGTARMLCI
jgi:putative acetyltransferase